MFLELVAYCFGFSLLVFLVLSLPNPGYKIKISEWQVGIKYEKPRTIKNFKKRIFAL